MAIREEDEEEEEVKWVKHYSSSHQILLVGDGDFSFSLCLALSFGSASNICASSRDSYDTVIEKYKKAKSNLETLKKLGAHILHNVDATKMKSYPDLKMRKFDRIVFNFPHAGFHGKEDNELLISMHKNVVGGFFRNARSMLRANGEVHVSHKTTPPYDRWDLEELARRNSLSLNDSVPFKIEDYPGYNNKRGEGSGCDAPFLLGECSTFKFRLFSGSENKPRVASYKGRINRRAPQLQETFFGGFRNVRVTFPRVGNAVDYYAHDSVLHTQTNFTRNVNELPGYVGLTLRSGIRRESVSIFDGRYDNVRETLGGPGHNVNYSVHGSLFSESERYIEERSSRTSNGYLYYEEELQRQTEKSAQLRRMVLLYGNHG